MKETIPDGCEHTTLGKVYLKIDSRATPEGRQESYT
jgi:hypothetical protein